MFKAKEIARWFLLRNKIEQDTDEGVEAMTNLKIQKLLYYAQGVYLAITNEKLFTEDLLAWKHGPVVNEVYQMYKGNGGGPIKVAHEELDEQIVIKVGNDSDVADTLEFVFNEYNQFSAWGLRNKTHNERPWKETKVNDVISTKLIKEYFKDEVVEVN